MMKNIWFLIDKNKFILFYFLLNFNANSDQKIDITNIDKISHQIDLMIKKNQYIKIVENFEDFYKGQKLQYFYKNKLLKITHNSNNRADQIYRTNFYFYNRKLIFVKKETLSFKNDFPKEYDRPTSYDYSKISSREIEIKKIYLKKNSIFSILINEKKCSNNGELKATKDFINYHLENYLHLSNIIGKPKYRIFESDKNQIFWYHVDPSSFESKLKITYYFENAFSKLSIYDYFSGLSIQTSYKLTNNNESLYIDFENYYSEKKIFLGFNISIFKKSQAKWWLKIEFEGDEIQIG